LPAAKFSKPWKISQRFFQGLELVAPAAQAKLIRYGVRKVGYAFGFARLACGSAACAVFGGACSAGWVKVLLNAAAYS
jgi:hypothetical protein